MGLRTRIKTGLIRSELVSSSVVGKEYELKKLRHVPGAELQVKTRKQNSFFIAARGYDAHQTVGKGTLCS